MPYAKTLSYICAAVGTIGVISIITHFCKKKSRKFKYILVEKPDDWYANEENIIKTLTKSIVIGLDCEWVTFEDKRKPVALLQLANKDGFCVLVRLCSIKPWFMPAGLIDILLSNDVLKVGVGINEDIKKLFNDCCCSVDNFLDLRFMARDLQELQGKGLGLKVLSKELLKYDLDKSHEIRCSNWEAPKLTKEQIEYAASDAIISAKLFFEIIYKKYKDFTLGNVSELPQDVLDVINLPFKQVIHNKTSNMACNSTNQSHKKSYKTRYSMPRQKLMYSNCQLLAPDGEILCSCDKAKAEWYVHKGLGEKIKDVPYTVQLKFEPSGRPTLDNVFYCKEKSNICVVCGRTENFHRKIVVPSEYRKNFPNLMKKNLSHDVLLLCVNCHKRSNLIDQEMRQKLADLCDAPLGCRKNIKYKSNPELARVKSAATALSNPKAKIPETRCEELRNVIRKFYGVSELSNELIDEAKSLDSTIYNDNFIAHGLKVYQYFCKNGGILELEKLWRQHFLDTMNPQFLPEMWSVDHNHKRLILQVVNREREIDFDTSILGITEEQIKEAQASKISN